MQAALYFLLRVQHRFYVGSVIAHKLYLSKAALISNEANYWCSSIINTQWKQHRANRVWDSLRGSRCLCTFFFVGIFYHHPHVLNFQPNAFDHLAVFGTHKLTVTITHICRGEFWKWKETCKFNLHMKKWRITWSDHNGSDWIMICSIVAKTIWFTMFIAPLHRSIMNRKYTNCGKLYSTLQVAVAESIYSSIACSAIWTQCRGHFTNKTD